MITEIVLWKGSSSFFRGDLFSKKFRVMKRKIGSNGSCLPCEKGEHLNYFRAVMSEWPRLACNPSDIWSPLSQCADFSTFHRNADHSFQIDPIKMYYLTICFCKSIFINGLCNLYPNEKNLSLIMLFFTICLTVMHIPVIHIWKHSCRPRYNTFDQRCDRLIALMFFWHTWR